MKFLPLNLRHGVAGSARDADSTLGVIFDDVKKHDIILMTMKSFYLFNGLYLIVGIAVAVLHARDCTATGGWRWSWGPSSAWSRSACIVPAAERIGCDTW